MVIMISDGACVGDEEGTRLVELLTEEWDDDLEVMAGKIISRTAKTREKDDVSVILTRIKEE